MTPEDPFKQEQREETPAEGFVRMAREVAIEGSAFMSGTTAESPRHAFFFRVGDEKISILFQVNPQPEEEMLLVTVSKFIPGQRMLGQDTQYTVSPGGQIKRFVFRDGAKDVARFNKGMRRIASSGNDIGSMQRATREYEAPHSAEQEQDRAWQAEMKNETISEEDARRYFDIFKHELSRLKLKKGKEAHPRSPESGTS